MVVSKVDGDPASYIFSRKALSPRSSQAFVIGFRDGSEQSWGGTQPPISSRARHLARGAPQAFVIVVTCL
ncbi:hypothetical protein TIFTF001_024007 [Ficus carica]|uniref:Uncharacterized protein n=1 Tax=Ficus carica TaxID=3494 RepID=A0AA88APC1_FICCA|nr:hypothetical protein TIFTF001_024007 [Ficus carica]